MNKNLIVTFVAILALSLSNFFAPHVFADEGDDIVTGTVSDEGFDSSEEPTETVTPETPNTPEDIENPDPSDSSENTETDSTLEDDIIHEGTSGEPEVVCADPNEPGCSDPAVDPELWPLILSLSVLGGTILFVIIINLINRNKRR